MRSINITMVLPYQIKRKKYWRNWATGLHAASHVQHPDPSTPNPTALRLISVVVGSVKLDHMDSLMKGRD